MAKKRKLARPKDEDAEPQAVLPQTKPLTTGMGALLERAGLKTLPPQKSSARQAARMSTGAKPPNAPAAPKAAPRPAKRPSASSSPVRATADASAWSSAYRGVQPIRGRRDKGRVRAIASEPPPPSADDVAARARLAALVGGGVRFDVRRDGAIVQALRAGGDEHLLVRCESSGFEPEATLDLHGLREEDARRQVSELVRQQHRRGRRQLLIIVGKGLHSESGEGVLAFAALSALTEGTAAPLVAALSSAHGQLGGTGALAVILR